MDVDVNGEAVMMRREAGNGMNGGSMAELHARKQQTDSHPCGVIILIV